MAFLLPVPNGNPWPKSWAIQLPFIGNNLSNPRPSKYQQSVKLAYSRDIRTFRKYYNKNISQVVCSGIAMPRVVSSRCKLIKTLELYDHSQVRSSLHNLKCLKLGQIAQKKVPINTIKRLVRYNKNLKEVWVDQNETMKFIASNMKCPRQLLTFSIGLCNLSKDKMRDGMKFLNRHRKLKEIALCSTAPPATQARSINKESEAFTHLLTSLFKKSSLKAMKLDVADSEIVHNKHLLEIFLLKRIQEKSLENFDIRLALTQLPLLNQVVQEILGNIDYFALSINGSPFHSNNFPVRFV